MEISITLNKYKILTIFNFQKVSTQLLTAQLYTCDNKLAQNTKKVILLLLLLLGY
jgi:hypothetical protein